MNNKLPSEGYIAVHPRDYHEDRILTIKEQEYVPLTRMDVKFIDSDTPQYRFNEDKTMAEIKSYIDATYLGPYVGKRDIQAFDMIKSCGHGLGFCLGNAIKYSVRYGKKEGFNRKDIMKAIHYLIMGLYVVDDENIK